MRHQQVHPVFQGILNAVCPAPDINCPTCKGDGEIEDEANRRNSRCPHCHGKGVVNRAEWYT